jgi:hypothetical protein
MPNIKVMSECTRSRREGELLAGSLPMNKQKLVIAWIEIRKEELMADWNLAVNGQKIFTIKGLE